ncbi:MAG TPA: hypothetical protein VF516_15465 [Kofleriaceae bacterium]
MPRMRTLLFLSLVLVGCSDNSNNNPPADAATPDTTTVALDCPSYCTEIQANCTGANAQYPTETTNAHCLAACASFPTGTLADTSMNTLGCRIYHAGAPAKSDPATHCPHAGPGGDLTSVTSPPGTCGDACTSFCTLEIKACGTTTSAPTTGQYADMNACITACKAFPNSTHKYTITSAGDSLACRLYHATNAAITGNAATHCPHTGPTPAGATNPCLAGSAATP